MFYSYQKALGAEEVAMVKVPQGKCEHSSLNLQKPTQMPGGHGSLPVILAREGREGISIQ